MRIQTKLSAIFIAASLIPMLALYALLLDNARSMLLGHLESSQKKLIQYHTRQLSDAVTTDASILVGASHFPSVQGIIRSYSDATESVGRASLQQWKRQLHSLFNTLLETHSEVIQLDYVHQSGETLVSETRLKEMSSSQFTVSEALLARAQLLSKGEVAIQHRRGESMELATPVFDERSPKAPIFGFIILTLDFEQLVSDGLGDTESESLLLVDEDGYILWGHQLDALLSEVSHESYFNLQPEFYEGVKGREYKVDTDSEDNEIRSWRKLYYDANQKEHYWILLSITEGEQFYRSIHQLFRFGIIVATIIMIGAVLVIFLVARRLSAPIQQLTHNAQAIADGKTDTVGDIRETNDELGQLIQVFRHMTEALSESQGRLKAVIQTAQDAMILIDNKGVILTVNPAVQLMFGYEPDELIGHNVKRLMPEPDRSGHDGYLRNYRDTAKKKIIGQGREVKAVNKTGAVFDAALNVVEFEVDGQQLFSGILRDITEEKRSQIRLSEQNEELQVQNWLRQGLVGLAEVMQNEQSIQRLCEQALNYLCNYMQCAVGILYLQQDGELIQAAVHAHHTQPVAHSPIQPGYGLAGQAFQTQEVLHITDVPAGQFRVGTGFGEICPNDVCAVPLASGDCVVGVVELGSIKPMRAEQKQFLNMAAEPIGIALESAQNRDQLRTLLDKSQQQTHELQSKQEALHTANEELNEKRLELEAQSEELRQTNEELEEQRQALEDQQAVLSHNNHSLEEARVELSRRAEALESANRYKAEFLATMSHELRTPLNSILILSKILAENKKGNLTSEQIESANTINGSGSDLLMLINDILDLSKIDAGRLDLEIDAVNLMEMSQRLEMLFSAQMAEKGLLWRVHVDAGCPPIITSDQFRIEQVVKNLLSNAIKFTDSGAITLSFLPAEHDGSQEYVLDISVEDSGIGIAQDKQEKIFEAFQQVDGSITRRYGGTGLGLAISRRLSEQWLFSASVR